MRITHWFTTILSLSGLLPFSTALSAQDPLAGTESLTAPRLVEAVLAQNPGVEALRAAAEQATFQIGPAGALDDPTLTYSLAPETLDGRLNQRIEFSQTLPWPGTLELREDAARSQARAADQTLADLRLEAAASAAAGFAEWHFVHRALEINEANQALLIELREVAETRYATGRATQQDVLQAEVEHARLQDQALELVRTRDSVQARLNALLNRDPERPLPPPAELPEPQAVPDFAALQQAALTSHPELERLQAERAASEAREGLAEKDFYPDFRVTTGYNSLWDEQEKRFTVGASINLPLDRSKYRAALDAAQAGANRARWQLQDRRAQLLAELQRARAELAEARDVITLHEERLLPLARENLAAAETDYRAGAGDFLNVITAENQKLATELGLERARADYARRLAELERWTGAPLKRLSQTGGAL